MGDLTLFCLIVGGNGKVFPVDISGGKSVGHLKEAIREKKKILKQYDADQLQLYLGTKYNDMKGEWMKSPSTERTKLSNSIIDQNYKDIYLKEEMDGTWKLKKYFNTDTPEDETIHVLVKLPEKKEGKNDIPMINENLKAYRQQRYKDLSVASSSRKYLDAIARSIYRFYDFNTKYLSPTMGDVLHAKRGAQGKDWTFREARSKILLLDPDGFEVEIKKGQHLTKTKLPDLYTPDEWIKISDFNKQTTDKVHDAELPLSSSGRPYVVIPHEIYNEDTIKFLQQIGVKANLFLTPNHLIVKDADVLSEGSSICESLTVM